MHMAWALPLLLAALAGTGAAAEVYYGYFKHANCTDFQGLTTISTLDEPDVPCQVVPCDPETNRAIMCTLYDVYDMLSSLPVMPAPTNAYGVYDSGEWSVYVFPDDGCLWVSSKNNHVWSAGGNLYQGQSCFGELSGPLTLSAMAVATDDNTSKALLSIPAMAESPPTMGQVLVETAGYLFTVLEPVVNSSSAYLYLETPGRVSRLHSQCAIDWSHYPVTATYTTCDTEGQVVSSQGPIYANTGACVYDAAYSITPPSGYACNLSTTALGMPVLQAVHHNDVLEMRGRDTCYTETWTDSGSHRLVLNADASVTREDYLDSNCTTLDSETQTTDGTIYHPQVSVKAVLAQQDATTTATTSTTTATTTATPEIVDGWRVVVAAQAAQWWDSLRSSARVARAARGLAVACVGTAVVFALY
jgi:hypothetical protein